jgi:integrase
MTKPKDRPRRAPNKRRLTELYVRRAKPRAGTYVAWDSMQRGLALRVQPTGGKSWFCVYSRHGRPRWLRLGNADSIGLAAARLLAAEVMVKVARGGDPAAERRAERGSNTFGELATRYLEEHAKKHNRSWKQAATLIERHCLPRWAKLQAASISRADVKQMMARIEAPIVANQTLAALSAIYTWAIEDAEILEANPCKGVKRNPTTARRRVLSDSEVPRFWKAFGEAGIAGMALRVLLLTGQRPGEVAHMRREHIADGWWQLPGAPDPKLGWPGTKNAEDHRVWLTRPVLALIDELQGDDDKQTGYVFQNSRGGAVAELDEVMRAICAKLKVERATPHDLRRTNGTTITGLGLGRPAMHRIQNHSQRDELGDVYDQYEYANDNKRVWIAVAARIMHLVEGRSDEKVVPFAR